MGFWNGFKAWKSARSASNGPHRSHRTCHFEVMEPRRMLDADPLFIGSVFIEDDSGADAAGDQFYVSFEGGSETTELTRLVIDTNQDGDSTRLGEPDVYFDVDASNQNGEGLGSGGAHNFTLSEQSMGVTWDDVSFSVVDGGTRLVLDLENFTAGDLLVFSVDVDQFFSHKPDDQITSGIEFAGSRLTAEFSDAHWEFSAVGAGNQGVYSYGFGFGSDDLADTGTLSALPSEMYRIADNGFHSIENRTAGAMTEMLLTPKPVTITGTVWHDENMDLIKDGNEYGIEGVILRLQKQDDSGDYVDVSSGADKQTWATTDATGFYSFGVDLGLGPGIYRVVETQPESFDISVGETVGNVAATASGVANGLSGNVISDIEIPLGGTRGVDYNFAEARTASICGYVYHDQNQNGVRDQGEEGIGGVEIMVTSLSPGFVTIPHHATTAEDGSYCIEGLLPGEYQILQPSQPAGFGDGLEQVGTVLGNPVGWAENLGDRIMGVRLGSGDHGVEYNFGEYRYGSIQGAVYHDLNDNGLFETHESGIEGVELQLYDSQGNLLERASTDAQGRYQFGELLAGTYRVVEIQPEGFVDGKDALGTVGGMPMGAVESDGDGMAGITLAAGKAGIDYNFGEIQYGTIRGRVIADVNGDCQVDPALGESGVPGVRIDLLDLSGQLVSMTFTDESGHYRFDQLRPGTYSILEHQPLGYYQGSEHVGERADGTGSGPGRVVAENQLGEIGIESGDQLIGYDFCEEPSGMISGFVYQDGAAVSRFEADVTNPSELLSVRDGQRTPDDSPIAGVVVELRNGVTGEPILGEMLEAGDYREGAVRTITDARGYYEFKGLPAGNYAVFEIHPEGYVDHVDTPGTSSGVAINPGRLNPAVLSTLSQGVDPNNDAILRIALGVGEASIQNNFSEVRAAEPWIYIPPATPPEFAAPLFLASMPLASPFALSGAQGVTSFEFQPFTGGGIVEYSWHLSVLDGGVTRGQYDPSSLGDESWQTVRHMSGQRWMSLPMRDGEWLTGNNDDDASNEPSFSVKILFGIEGGTPLIGDFNGDGIDEVAIFKNGEWFIDLNGNRRWDSEDLWADLGTGDDRPVVGDWDGDGKDDIGIFGPRWPKDEVAIAREPGLPDPANVRASQPKNLPPSEEEATSGVRSVKVSMHGATRQDLIDHVFEYGASADQPIAGDWNGDGIRTVGIFSQGTWILDSDADGRMDAEDSKVRFGQPGDVPVVGDWNGDGVEQLGIYRDGLWVLDLNGNREIDATDKVFEMGGAEDVPMAGDFDGDGVDEASLYRSTTRKAG